MKSYDTSSEALRDLKRRGFTLDFNLKENCIACDEENLQLAPEAFQIKEVYRFEGNSNPSDEEVVYAIESNDGRKGVIVNAFGIYSDSLSDEMIAKLDRK